MNLDELLASLSKAAAPGLANRPIAAVGDYIPFDSTVNPLLEKGGISIVGCLVHWLVTRNQLSVERKKSNLTKKYFRNTSVEVLVDMVVNFFERKIVTTDIADEVVEFSRAYCMPSGGGLSSDFHELFVEGTDLNSFCDVELSSERLDEIAKLIDLRYSLQKKSDPDWCRPLVQRGKVEFVQESSASIESWISAIQSFENLPQTPSGQYKTRLKDYWATIEAASQYDTLEVANELIRTYLWNPDSSSQTSVWRILRIFPTITLTQALLDNISALSEKTKWSSTLVDIFDDDLGETEIDQMTELINETEQTTRLRYVSALTTAKREGSLFADRLLGKLYPSESI